MSELTVVVALSAVLALGLSMVAASSPAAAQPETTQSQIVADSGHAWGNGGANNTARPLWVYEACAGEFISSNVAAGGFVWGGEQSCTSSSPQTLEFILENVTQGGDNLVAAPFKAWTGYQNYIHTTTLCQSSQKTLYREYAYGTANGVQLQPYPASKGFYLNCYHAGDRNGCTARLLQAVQTYTAGTPAAKLPNC